MRFLPLLFGVVVLAAPAWAEPVPAFYVGANAVWFNADATPSDFEVGGTARASLSPHISAVGSAFYGTNHSYLVGEVGVRVTATDVNNKDFSIGIGLEYQASSAPELRPEEWLGKVVIGYRPWPAEMPAVTIGAGAQYGLTTTENGAFAAVRYRIGGAQ